MPYTFDKNNCQLLFAREYLNRFKHRGRALAVRHLGLKFHGLTGCLFLGGKGQAILPAEGDKLPFIFRDSCNYGANEVQLASLAEANLNETPETHEIDEAAPLAFPGAANLWHWTTEGLPKLLALESIGYTGSYIIPSGGVSRKSLEMFGIAPERILPAEKNYFVKRLMLPQRLSGFDMVDYMPLAEFTREKLLAAAGGPLPGAKRCYVRRIGRRKVRNEDEVLAVLDDFGFESMTPEDLPLAEQWRYMTNVECSVTAHGANSTLSLLQKPRSGFVELFGNRYVSYNNLHAVRLLRLNYRPLVQDLDVSSVPPLDSMSFAEFMWSGYDADILVDTTHLRIILETLLD